MGVLLALGLVLIAGLVGGLLSRRLNLPSITGFVVVGLVLGPTVSGVIDAESVLALDAITGISLGVIAYLIGTSLRMGVLRSLGRSISTITLLEATGAFIAVAVALVLTAGYFIPGGTLRQTYIPFALVMGATACPTAPAAVMAIVREYRAKGPLTTTLLAVVALDDAVGVIFFAAAIAVSAALIGNGAAATGISVVLKPVMYVVAAIGMGAAFAFAALALNRFVRVRETRLVLVLGTVILCYGLADMVGASGIMANMALGCVLANRKSAGDMTVALDEIEAVLYTMFFVLAGLHFESAALASAGPLALIILVVRCLGKYAGTRLGARIGGAERQVGQYLGLALLPQAGVSIGLTLIATATFPELAGPMVSATLASVIMNELLAPPLARNALVRAGEARPEDGKDEVRRAGATPVGEAAAHRDKAETHVPGVSVGVFADRSRDPHLSEGPWTRTQRARDLASRNSVTRLTDTRRHSQDG